MKIGVRLRWVRDDPAVARELVQHADRIGFDSVWLPEHVIVPVVGPPAGAEIPDHRAMRPDDPQLDPFVYLGYLAATTQRIRLGTSICLLALRHPFVAARAIQTLDVLSGGRAEIGVGAGWLRGEWEALELEYRTRGRRLDEVIDICRRLWSEREVAQDGEFFRFPPVAFEPKPVQRPGPPILVGGESTAALRRAARLGDGWLGRDHTPASVRPFVERLASFRRAEGRDHRPFEVAVRTTAAMLEPLAQWEEVGVTRLIIAPGDGPVDDVGAAMGALSDIADRLSLGASA